jgi:hypothetical protein
LRFRQKKVVAAGRRIQVFLDTNKDRVGPVDEGNARGILDEVVTNLEALGGQQDPTRFQRKRELQEERNARYDLREIHMRPIATIADMSLREVPEFEHLRLPPKQVDTQTHIQWAREMAKAAEPHQPVFIRHGLGQDFIAKLNASTDGAQKAVDQRWRNHTSRVGATSKLRSETRRALGVFEVLDALVAPKLKDDDQLSQDWKLSKRIAKRAALAALAEDGTEAAGGVPPGVTPTTSATTPTPDASTPPATTAEETPKATTKKKTPSATPPEEAA